MMQWVVSRERGSTPPSLMISLQPQWQISVSPSFVRLCLSNPVFWQVTMVLFLIVQCNVELLEAMVKKLSAACSYMDPMVSTWTVHASKVAIDIGSHCMKQ
jgi:hypothetical protein